MNKIYELSVQHGYQVFTLANKLIWQKFVRNSVFHDFYHSWTYHFMEKSGTPKLFVYSEGEDFIALPVLVRPVLDTEYSDITSVYGYAGPVSNVKFEDMAECLKNNFKNAFINFLKAEKNISVFCRLHPFTNQEILLEKFGGLHSNGRTVVIDLRTTIEAQRSKYRRTIKENINHLRNNGYQVKEAKNGKGIQDFIEIYLENMRRIGASENYLFDEDYFLKLLNSDEIDSKLLLVYFNGEAICGTIIIYTNKIIQGHLMCTKTNYLKKSPAKLLVDEVSVLGRADNMEYYHLGGGIGGNDDSLFNWKAGFSDMFLNFKTWRLISDENAYNELTNNVYPVSEESSDFFPLYRRGGSA